MTLAVKVELNPNTTKHSATDETQEVQEHMNRYFMLSGRISRNIAENIFRSYTGSTSENTDFHVLVA